MVWAGNDSELWSFEPAIAATVMPLTVPFGPVSVTCDGVNVAGLISSLKVTLMLVKLDVAGDCTARGGRR